ncbi:MAG: UbiD family decarboxylase [Rhodospirillaceae bacterium]|nr:UbiD family decarboxylase [Rhodospirillaceae bacterium]
MTYAKTRGYNDMQDHLAALDAAGLLTRIDAPINKDSELSPLVRWQFRGGIPEAERKAFLFTNVTGGDGRVFDIPVTVGALAGNAEIYSVGMGVPVAEIGNCWSNAIANPIAPVVVEDPPCQEIVYEGADLTSGKGLDALPVPVSTPGYDSAPYLTATACVTSDPDTGIQNLGTYRGGLKAPDRIGLKLFMNLGQGGTAHWEKYRTRGEAMPIAMVIGCPPPVAYAAPQKLAKDVDELGVAGGIAGAPIRVAKARTSDLFVPADAEIVIEGLLDPEYFEPEGPFGESHGHINLEEFNFILTVTAITRRSNAVFTSIISQVTPSESSVIKRVAYEPLFLNHLTGHLGVRGVKRVAMHEPLTNLRKVLVIQFDRSVARTEIWRALYGAMSFQAPVGKYLIAVNEDIDPDNLDAVFWAMSYRANLAEDCELMRHRPLGHGPKSGADEDATLLIDATLKADMAPVALPKREYMEHAKELWEQLGLPPLKPEAPWHGYELGDWSAEWDTLADRAAAGDWISNGERSHQQRRTGVEPNTDIRNVGDDG